MISTNVSNVKNISLAYNSVENRLNDSIGKLKDDYEEYTKGNVFYKKVSTGNIVFSIIIDVLLVYGILQYATLYAFIQERVGYDGLEIGQFSSNNTLSSLIYGVLTIICVYCIYMTGVKFYCKRIEGYSRRIQNVERKAAEAMGRLKSQQISMQMIKAAMNNEEFSIDSRNDLGQEIVRIREGFMSANQKAHNVKRAIRFVVTGILCTFLVVFSLTKIGSSVEVTRNCGLSVALMNIIAIIVIGISQINLGEYLGKYTKLVGCVVAIIYSCILYFSLSKIFNIPFVDFDGQVQPYNKACIIVPLLQLISIILAVSLSHYGVLKEKIEQGFEVPMLYGNKPDGNKVILFFRMAVASFWAILICVIVAGEVISGFLQVVIFAVLWYMANCLVKPRGSYLYAFWGPGRSIANELVMVSIVISAAVCSRGTLSMEELICMGIGVIGSFVIGGIATAVNNMIF